MQLRVRAGCRLHQTK